MYVKMLKCFMIIFWNKMLIILQVKIRVIIDKIFLNFKKKSLKMILIIFFHTHKKCVCGELFLV